MGIIDRVKKIEVDKKEYKEELEKLKICPNCKTKMLGEYTKNGNKIIGSFTCLVCDTSVNIN